MSSAKKRNKSTPDIIEEKIHIVWKDVANQRSAAASLLQQQQSWISFGHDELTNQPKIFTTPLPNLEFSMGAKGKPNQSSLQKM